VTDGRLSARVFGRVQGVGFRWWVVREAEALGLTGWVMNHEDERSVELVAEGSTSGLDRLEQLLHDGPPGARVERVEVARGPASREFRGFGIARP
jgi:acylphosphatase